MVQSQESTQSPTARADRHHLVFAGMVGLVAVSPLGHDASQPFMFLVYRTLLVGLTLVCYRELKGRPCRDLPIGVYVLGAAVLALMALSVWATPGGDPTGWTVWSEHLLFGLAFVAYARYAALQSPRWKTRLLSSVIGITLFHLVLRTWMPTDPALGLFANANYFAAYLLVGFGSAVALAFHAGNLRFRLLAGGCGLVLFYGITESLSRGATLAALALVGLALWLYKGRRAMTFVAAPALALALGIVAYNPDLVTQFTDRGEVDPYNYKRLEIWASTAALIADQPLLGVGPAEYEHVARRYRFPVEGTIGRFMKRASIAHSEYLHYAAETGAPAALLILGLVGYYLWLLVRRRREDLPEDSGRSNAAAVLVISGICLHALVDNVFQVSVVTASIAVIGLAGAPLSQTRRVPGPTSRRGAAWLALAVSMVFSLTTLIPGLAYALDAGGHRSLGQSRIEDAIGSYRSAVALRPNDAQLLTDLGLAYQQQYRATGELAYLDTADAYLGRARRLRPRLLPARQAWADSLVLRLGGDASDVRIHAKLVEAYRAILDLDPFLPLARHNLARALYQSGRPREAFEELELTLALEPNFVPGYRTLAGWYGQSDARGRSLLAEAEAIVARYAVTDRLTDYEATLLGRPRNGEIIR